MFTSQPNSFLPFEKTDFFEPPLRKVNTEYKKPRPHPENRLVAKRQADVIQEHKDNPQVLFEELSKIDPYDPETFLPRQNEKPFRTQPKPRPMNLSKPFVHPENRGSTPKPMNLLKPIVHPENRISKRQGSIIQEHIDNPEVLFEELSKVHKFDPNAFLPQSLIDIQNET